VIRPVYGEVNFFNKNSIFCLMPLHIIDRVVHYEHVKETTNLNGDQKDEDQKDDQAN